MRASARACSRASGGESGSPVRHRVVTRGWLVLALSACAPRLAPASAAPTTPSVVVGEAREVPAAPTFVDPPAPPCPTPGWATAATLTGAWQGGYSARRSSDDPPPSYLRLYRGVQVRLRHDYHPDGTATSVELTRFHELANQQTGAHEDGTWRVGPSGEVEVSWRTPSLSRTLRERVWIDVESGGVAVLARRTLERGADGVWRGARWSEEVGVDGVTSDSETRIELRFKPALAPDASACEVEITRSLAVSGRGKPARWTDRARRRCEILSGRVMIDAEPFRWPEHDARLRAAYEQFDPRSLVWLAPDVLHDDDFDASSPRRRARPAEPPLSWQEVGSVERCRRADAPAGASSSERGGSQAQLPASQVHSRQP